MSIHRRVFCGGGKMVLEANLFYSIQSIHSIHSISGTIAVRLRQNCERKL